jgi:hypothetical protein
MADNNDLDFLLGLFSGIFGDDIVFEYPELDIEEIKRQPIIQLALAKPEDRHVCPAAYGMEFILTAAVLYDIITYSRHPKLNAYIVQAKST